MSTIRLKKLIRDKQASQLLDKFGQEFDCEIQLEDAGRRCIYGNPEFRIAEPVAIKTDDIVIGYLHSSRNPAFLTSFLSLLVSQQIERRTLARETLDKYSEINLLYRVAEKLTTSIDLEKVAQLFIDEARHTLRTTRITLMLFDDTISKLVVIGSSVVDCKTHPSFSPGEGIAGHVFESGTPEVIDDVDEDSRFVEGSTDIRSILCAPLRTADNVIGIINACSDKPSQYTTADLKLITALGLLAGSAIDNIKIQQELIREKLHAQSMEQDLEIGRQIQASFLPDSLPHLPDWEVASRFRSARQVSGDFFDVFPVAGGRMLTVVVADVCNKGVGAALFMGLFRSLIRAFSELYYPDETIQTTQTTEMVLGNTGVSLAAHHEDKLQQVISLTNDYIATTHGKTNMFATIFLAMVDLESGEMRYVNCGHEMPFLIGRDGIRQSLEPSGPAVGLMPKMEFVTRKSIIKPGEVLLIYTDGITEAMDAKRNFFGIDRLKELLTVPVSSAEMLLERIDETLNSHTGDAVQSDDITMLAIRFKKGDSKSFQ